MTAQEIFDKTVRHLRAQGCRAVGFGSDSCRYRGDGGTKCAVGVHISDERYTEAMEGGIIHNSLDSVEHTTKSALVMRALIESGVEEKHFSLLGHLQSAHDSTDPEFWPGRLREIAQMFGLSADVLDA